MVIQYGQAHQVYAMMAEIVEAPEMQARLDAMQAEADGNDKVYGTLVLQLLTEEVYPVIAPHFGQLEVGGISSFIQNFVKAIQVHLNNDWDLALHWAWLHLESVMRNNIHVAMARSWIQAGGKANWE